MSAKTLLPKLTSEHLIRIQISLAVSLQGLLGANWLTKVVADKSWLIKFVEHRVADPRILRFADDTILGFQYRTDADRFRENLRERLASFGLELHPDKTRRIEFGRFAEENRKRRGEGKHETVDFRNVTIFESLMRKHPEPSDRSLFTGLSRS